MPVATSLPDLRAKVRATVDARLGEVVRFIPQTTGQYRGSSTDPDRSPFDVICPVVIDDGGTQDVIGERMLGLAIPVGGAAFHVDAMVYPLILGVKEADRIEVLASGRAFRVQQIMDRPGQRAVVIGGLA